MQRHMDTHTYSTNKNVIHLKLCGQIREVHLVLLPPPSFLPLVYQLDALDADV